ncbi:MAG: ATP-dependent Clp protease adaptor protein ClpS, partial [uncultured Rubrobacteraceae bacterium]
GDQARDRDRDRAPGNAGAAVQGDPAQRRLHPDGARRGHPAQGHPAHVHPPGRRHHDRGPHQGQGRRHQVPQGARRALHGEPQQRGPHLHHRARL